MNNQLMKWLEQQVSIEYSNLDRRAAYQSVINYLKSTDDFSNTKYNNVALGTMLINNMTKEQNSMSFNVNHTDGLYEIKMYKLREN